MGHTHAEECVDAANLDLITKDLIGKTEYKDKRSPPPHVEVFEVPPHFLEEHLAFCLARYGQIMSPSSDVLNRRWILETIVGRKAFLSTPTVLM